ncbi:MAG: GAF domain-containing protein [Asticcacaulis sp.]
MTFAPVSESSTFTRPDIAAYVRNIVRIFALVLGAAGFFGEVLTVIYMLHGAPGTGELGARFQRTVGPGQQHSIVTRIDPRSPLLAAGIHPGDAVRFDHPVDDGVAGRRFAQGERIGMTVLGPRPRHITVAAALPHVDTPEFIQLIIIDCSTSFLSIALGALIMLRARGSNALVALGLGFIVFASFSTIIPQNQTPLVFFFYSLAFQSMQGLLATLALLYFSIEFYRENTGAVARWVWPAFGLYALIYLLITVGWCVLGLWNYALPLMEQSGTLVVGWSEVGFACAFMGLAIGWRRSRLDMQRRYAIMTVAISLVIICDVMFVWSFNAEGGFGTPKFQMWYMAAEWMSAAGHLLFAYAVLRDKVIDLGFVINRAVVYGVISACLLVIFGVVEWAVEHFIPIESREKSALIDAAIALAIYLVFHRVRDTVERFIERLFFHKWHANEAALRRFVHEADFITEPVALLDAFQREVVRFCSGANVQVALRNGDGDLVSDNTCIAANDPVFVALRARHAAVEPASTGSGLAAALVLPFSHRGDVFGCVVVASNPGGMSYRPDEIEVLTWAAHQIGLDYHALRVEALEREAAALREQNTALNGAIAHAMARTPV